MHKVTEHSELDELVNKLRAGGDIFKLSDSPAIAKAMRDAADLLDAARPQRASVDGECFCEEWPWEYHTPGAPSNMEGTWSRMEAEYGSPTHDMTTVYHFGTFCCDCGAALLATGYAERGGDPQDTRRLDALIAIARQLGGETSSPVIELRLIIEPDGSEAWTIWQQGLIHEPIAGAPMLRAAIDDAASHAEPGGDERDNQTGDDTG